MPKLKPFRCQNPACTTDPHKRLIFDFWAERGICPKCKTDRREHLDVVIPLTIHHFDPPHSTIKGKGQHVRACTGKPFDGAQMTGDPRCVNCPDCRATEEWKAAVAELDDDTLLDENHEDYEALRAAVAAADTPRSDA